MLVSDIEGAHAAYCTLAALIAKSNTLIRDRYPHSHALHQRCEQSFFGVFWDMAADAAGPQALACQTRRAQSALPLQLRMRPSSGVSRIQPGDAALQLCRLPG